MPRVVVFDAFGGPDVLQVVDQPRVAPGAGEVRIRMEAFAVNPLDVMMRSGTAPGGVRLPQARLGIEGTGIVDAVGADVDSLREGDAVIVAALPDPAVRGTYADFVTLPEAGVVHRPRGLDVGAAAALWVGFSTAYGTLVERAGIRPGDTVLVTAASGSVGRAAVQVAAHVGAIPIAVTRDGRKAEELQAAGAHAVVAAGDDLVADVRRLTGGRGADVTLDLVRGPGQRDLLEATRPGGMLVAAGFLDPRPTPEPPDDTRRLVGYRGFDLLLDTAARARMVSFMDDALALGALRPAIDSTFDLAHVADAHRRFDAGAHRGKIVVLA